MNSHEITTLDEYRLLAGQRVGAIVITDVTGKRIHRPDCRTITEARFTEKVINNRNKNGRYYYFQRLEDAEQMFSAPRCGLCF